MDLLIALCILLERFWRPHVEASYAAQSCRDLLLRRAAH